MAASAPITRVFVFMIVSNSHRNGEVRCWPLEGEEFHRSFSETGYFVTKFVRRRSSNISTHIQANAVASGRLYSLHAERAAHPDRR